MRWSGSAYTGSLSSEQIRALDDVDGCMFYWHSLVSGKARRYRHYTHDPVLHPSERTFAPTCSTALQSRFFLCEVYGNQGQWNPRFHLQWAVQTSKVYFTENDGVDERISENLSNFKMKIVWPIFYTVGLDWSIDWLRLEITRGVQ